MDFYLYLQIRKDIKLIKELKRIIKFWLDSKYGIILIITIKGKVIKEPIKEPIFKNINAKISAHIKLGNFLEYRALSIKVSFLVNINTPKKSIFYY